MEYVERASGKTVDMLLKPFDGYYLQFIPTENPCTLANGTPFPDKTTVLQVISAVNQLLQLIQ